MSISGNLTTMELSELLQWVAQGARTGTLVIESDSVVKRVYFRDGKIVASGSTLESEQLGHFLVSHGYITDEELTKAIAMQEETGMLLGKILVTIGGISEEELLELLVMQTEESVYDLFTWSQADFRFIDGETLNRGMIPLALDVTAITLQGMNRLDEWSRIRKLIPSSEVVPIVVSADDKTARSAADRHILNALDDQSSIGEISHRTRTSEFQVSRLLLRELNEARVKVVLPRQLKVVADGARDSPKNGADQGFSVGSSSDASPTEPQAQSNSGPAGAAPASQSVSENSHAFAPDRTEAVSAEPTIEPVSEPHVDGSLLAKIADSLLETGDYESALRHFRAAAVLEPRNSKVKEGLTRAEDRIRTHVQTEGLDLDSVPVLERSLEQLTDLQLSPEQGFLLTRIDGTLSINSLLKLSPLDRIDGELVFFRLIQQGHVRVV